MSTKGEKAMPLRRRCRDGSRRRFCEEDEEEGREIERDGENRVRGSGGVRVLLEGNLKWVFSNWALALKWSWVLTSINELL